MTTYRACRRESLFEQFNPDQKNSGSERCYRGPVSSARQPDSSRSLERQCSFSVSQPYERAIAKGQYALRESITRSQIQHKCLHLQTETRVGIFGRNAAR